MSIQGIFRSRPKSEFIRFFNIQPFENNANAPQVGNFRIEDNKDGTSTVFSLPDPKDVFKTDQLNGTTLFGNLINVEEGYSTSDEEVLITSDNLVFQASGEPQPVTTVNDEEIVTSDNNTFQATI